MAHKPRTTTQVGAEGERGARAKGAQSRPLLRYLQQLPQQHGTVTPKLKADVSSRRRIMRRSAGWSARAPAMTRLRLPAPEPETATETETEHALSSWRPLMPASRS
jgi:hypothetical protein